MTKDSVVVEQYERDGFVFPIDVLNPAEASEIRADLEAAEAELAEDPERLALLRAYTDRVLPSFDKLIRNNTLIAAAKSVLGPDLMVWSAQMFTKEANSPKIISWHQDLTYWGLDDAEEATCWVALSPATRASGCMKFVPGSHKEHLVPHVDTYADNNMLSRGQEIAVEVNEADAVEVELQPGQASLHHGHLFHASGPNTTDDRRIGVAIRYIKPSMKQRSGDRSLVAHVSGEDRYGHFNVVGSPKGRLVEKDFELCRRDAEIKRRVLYEGADPSRGKRY
ncbi:MAG: phytanoyl-CoA dioxygenase family protein [Rhizobiaceae bacterium]